MENVTLKDRIESYIAKWVLAHGEIYSDWQWANECLNVRLIKLVWHKKKYRVIEVNNLFFLIREYD